MNRVGSIAGMGRRRGDVRRGEHIEGGGKNIGYRHWWD